MKEWIEFFRDKRFGWKFKIANFIMGDYLRNYLAVGVELPLEKAREYYKYEDFCKQEIDSALSALNELFEM